MDKRRICTNKLFLCQNRLNALRFGGFLSELLSARSVLFWFYFE